jgi:hypothetical protein
VIRRRENLVLVAVIVAAPVLAYWIAPTRVAPEREVFSWYADDSVLGEANRRQWELRDSIRVLLSAWERLDTREKAMGLTARQAGLEIRADRDVPAATVARFAEGARAELRTLTASPAYPVVVRIVFDPMTRANYRRGTALPERAGAPCVSVVRIGAGRRETNAPYRGDQLLGVCGLYALFGAPGAGMDRWLERTALATAPGHTGTTAAPRLRQRIEAQYLHAYATPAACLVGRDAPCVELFDGVHDPFGRWMSATPANAPRRVAVFGAADAIAFLGTDLPGLRASLGDTRFAAIWRSASEPAEAYAALEGSPLAAWVRAQLARGVEPYRVGSMFAGVPLVLALVLIAAFTGAAVRLSRREYFG